MTVTPQLLADAPKVALHDHLDGGLRPATVLELADEIGHALPADDPDALAAWFHRGADRRDLMAYLETFAHTVAVMQTPEHLERVAYESAVDLADDGVVHAELRFAPELNTARGLSLDDVLEATTAGFERAMADRDVVVRTIVAAIRSADNADEAAAAAVRWADRGVVAFDLAGPEAGYPPAEHLDAIRTVQRAGLSVTLHAGEAHGLGSIREAVEVCGADRIGHGVRLVDDITSDGDGRPVLGELAQDVRDRGVPLENCPSSNLHTGAVATMAEHPVDRFLDLGFAVTVNTDNRLMSDTTHTRELRRCVDAFGWDVARVASVLLAAADAAFCTDVERDRIQRRITAWEEAAAAR